jgi:hypothetical protein
MTSVMDYGKAMARQRWPALWHQWTIDTAFNMALAMDYGKAMARQRWPAQ